MSGDVGDGDTSDKEEGKGSEPKKPRTPSLVTRVVTDVEDSRRVIQLKGSYYRLGHEAHKKGGGTVSVHSVFQAEKINLSMEGTGEKVMVKVTITP